MGRKGGMRRSPGKKRPKSTTSQKNRYRAYVSVSRPLVIPVRDGCCIPLVVLSSTAWGRIHEVVKGDETSECGALLIGNLLRDRITGAVLAFVDDAYTDGEYGSSSSYRFTASMQADAVAYCMGRYGETKHVIGTVHSHGVHDAFFSSMDDEMMQSRRSEEVHMVVSPSHGTFVLCFKGLDGEYSDAMLDASAVGGFPYMGGLN